MSGSSIDCTIPNCAMSILGFPASSGDITAPSDGYVIGSQNAVLNTLQQYLISCSIINGVYLNSALTNILAGVPIGKIDSYAQTQYMPIHPTRCSIFVSRIDSITFTLLDQNSNPIDFTNNGQDPEPESWNICVSIEPQDMQGIL